MKSYKGIKNRFIKVIFITFTGVFLLLPSFVFSQVSEGGLPPSFNYQQTRSVEAVTNVPVNFYIEDLRETDNWQAREGVPMPVSRLIQVDYNMDNSGYYTVLPGGENIWRFHLKAKNAVAIMLYYKDFYIPEGGKLFIYSADKTHILGAYTHNTHPSGGLFATEFIGGEELILEYVVSETSNEKPRILINEIGYGYNTAALREFCGITTRALSGSCMVDINCEEGDAWQNEKKSVCHMVQKIGSVTYICSGSLLNNTAEDFKPLILTARHCAYGGRIFASSSDMEQWMFYFNKEREGCGSDFLPAVSKTMPGCKMLVNTGTEGGSDGMLLLLNDMIPEGYDVFYNGWDRRDVAATSGVCLHHPKGDYMKVSTYDEAARVYTFMSSEFNGDNNAHWNVTFKSGVTDEGSSGSPLYNENKLVVGTLTGGNSSCSYLRGLNIYGKMSYHWDKYTTDSSTRMDVWIDPLNLGHETFPGRFRKIFKPSPESLKAVNLGQSVSLTWSIPSGSEAPKKYNVFRNNSKIGETTLLTFFDNEPANGSIIYSVSAVYADGDESTFTNTTMSFVKFKAPSDLRAERVSTVNNNVRLSWVPPVYEQEIFWSTMDIGYYLGLKDNRFYYGHRWSSSEIAPLNEKTIVAIRFVPREKSKYKIYISQGAKTYRQDIESSSLRYSDIINKITLDEPFVINGDLPLIVSIQIIEAGSDYPAVVDDGPVVDEKGNLYSYDGENWFKLYNENNPSKSNYNFVISAIVTSENGSLYEETRANISNVDYDIDIKVDSVLSVKSQVLELPLRNDNVSLRNSVPAAFPEVTGYKIYRCYSTCVASKEVGATVDTYLDNTASDYSYVVTALYGNIESENSNRAVISPVDIENVDASVDIYPTRFSDYVSLKGYEYVARVEVISVSGKVCLVVNHPDGIINTSSLSPGVYFFRISDGDGGQKVVKAIKAN